MTLRHTRARSRPLAPFLVVLLLATTGAACKKSSKHGTEGETCIANPFGDRALYLKGTFNSWANVDDQQFTYSCNRFELVTALSGEVQFKVADAAWSADADFGGPAALALGTAVPLALKGGNLSFAFDGTYRLVLDVSRSATAPTLKISACPEPPVAADLYLRGGMNSWAASADWKFAYVCDAYLLNLDATGSLEFKVADASWAPATSFGGAAGASTQLQSGVPFALQRDADAPAGTSSSNLSFAFTGPHTARLTFDASGGSPTLTLGPQTGSIGPRPVTDPVALGVTYNSRDLTYKTPFGAVPGGDPGTTVSFTVSAPAGVDAMTLVLEKQSIFENQVTTYAPYQTVTLSRAAGTGGAPDLWTGSFTFTDPSVYGYYVQVGIAGTQYVYGNNRDAVYETAERGSNGKGSIAFLPSSTTSIRRYRLTVYAPDFTVPSWAQDAVYYYIFPERFRNGDAANDPVVGVDLYEGQPIEVHSSWLDRPYLPGDGHSDAVYNNDFFGGDLQGVIDELAYIKGVGANTLYMTPVFWAGSNHKYDHGDYTQIDPHFGTNALFAELTRQAAALGIRVILDASFDHVGADSLYFNRYERWPMPAGTVGAFQGAQIQATSPFYDWFTFHPDATTPDAMYDYWAVASMPRITTTAPDFEAYTFGDPDSVSLYWLDQGAAGWRMDVAPWVSDAYWRGWRAAVKAHDPEALTIAETWFDSSKFFLGDTFDSTMNYIFKDAATAYAAGGDATRIYPSIELMRENYPPQAFYALMNLISSHDVPRVLYQLGYTDDTVPPDTIETAKARMVLATLFQAIMPGAPAIYYGDEVGVTGGADPYNRGTYPWADLQGTPDTALLEKVSALMKLRNDTAILRRGSFAAPLYLDGAVIVLARGLDDQWAVTALNNSATAETVTVTLPAGAAGVSSFTDALSGPAVAVTGGQITVTVPPLYGVVLLSR